MFIDLFVKIVCPSYCLSRLGLNFQTQPVPWIEINLTEHLASPKFETCFKYRQICGKFEISSHLLRRKEISETFWYFQLNSQEVIIKVISTVTNESIFLVSISMSRSPCVISMYWSLLFTRFWPPTVYFFQGGEVFDRLVEKVTFSEMETADLLVQLLCAVSFMHEQVKKVGSFYWWKHYVM